MPFNVIDHFHPPPDVQRACQVSQVDVLQLHTPPKGWFISYTWGAHVMRVSQWWLMWTNKLLLSERSMGARMHVRGVPYIAPPLPFPRPHLLSFWQPSKPGTWPLPSSVSFLAAFLIRNHIRKYRVCPWMKSPNDHPEKGRDCHACDEYARFHLDSSFLINVIPFSTTLILPISVCYNSELRRAI